MFNNKKRGKRILSFLFAIVLIISTIVITNAYTDQDDGVKQLGLSGEAMLDNNLDDENELDLGASDLPPAPEDDGELALGASSIASSNMLFRAPYATYPSPLHLVNNGKRMSMTEEWLVGGGWSFKTDGYLESLDPNNDQYVYDMATKYELRYINTSDRNQGFYPEGFDEFWRPTYLLGSVNNLKPYGGKEIPPFQVIPININDFNTYLDGTPIADKVLFEASGLYRVRNSTSGAQVNSVTIMFNNEFIKPDIYLFKGASQVDHNGATASSSNIYNPTSVKYASNRIEGKDNAAHLPDTHEIVTSNKWIVTNRDDTPVTKDKNGTALNTNASFVTGKNVLEFNPTVLPDGKYSAKVSETSTTRFGNSLGTKVEATRFIIITPLSKIDNLSTGTTAPIIGNAASWQSLQTINPKSVTIGGKYGGEIDTEMVSSVSYEIFKKDGTKVGGASLGTSKDNLSFENELALLGYGDYYIKVTDKIPVSGASHSTYAKFNVQGSYVKTEHYLNHPVNGPTPIGSWPPAVEGTVGNPQDTVGYNTTGTKYELVEVVEVVPGLPENIVANPSNQFTTTFPSAQGQTTTVKYYYREIVGITINKTLVAGAIGTDSFNFSIWQSDKTVADATTHTITLNPNVTSGSTLVNGLIAGQEYYIKEVISSPATSSYKFDSITGATFDGAVGAFKFTAPADGTQSLSVTATNLYNTVGLGIAKVITNNDGNLINSTDNFKITITGPRGYNQTFTIIPGTPANVTGLVVGQTYTITEVLPANSSYELIGITANNGITLTPIGAGACTFVAPSSSVTGVEITVSNAALLNNVSIKKVMAPLVNPLETDHKFDFFIWPLGDAKPLEPNVKDVTINGTAVTSPDFIVGKEYIIEEASSTGYLFEGFTGATSNGSGKYTFIVPAKGTALEITATNKLDTVPAGLVKLTKKLDSGNPYNVNDTFEITVSRVNGAGNLVDGVAYNVKVGEIAEVKNLIAGQKYRISETNIDSGYAFKSIGDGTTTETANSLDFIAPASNSVANVLFTVTNLLDKGQVVIEKGYGSSSPLASGETFNFKVWRQSENISAATSNPIVMSGGSSSITMDNLQGGVNYYIAEDTVAGYRLAEVRNGGSAITPVNIGGVIAYAFTAPTATSGTITLHFDNERDELAAGAVTIEKILTSPQTVLNTEDNFSVEIQRLNADNSVSSDAPITHDLIVGNAPTSILGLVAGEKYEISEVGLPVGYKFASLTDSEGNLALAETSSGSGKFRFTAPASNTPVGNIKLKLENTYKLIPAGKLQLIKDFGASRPLADGHTFDFFLWKDGEPRPSDDSVTIPNVGFLTPENLPPMIAGQKYYLAEKEFIGYTFLSFTANGITLTPEGSGVYSFIAPADSPATPILIKANNARATINGAVTLAKQAASTINAPESFTFLVWRNGDIRLDGIEYTVAANSTEATPIDGLIPGQEYFVEEYVKSGYKLSGIAGATKVSDNVYKFTVPNTAATPLALVATNEFSLVDITLVKTLDKPALGNDSFNFTIWRADQTEADGISASISLASGATTGNDIVSGLISGQDYYIKEVIANPSGNRYKFVSITGADFVSSMDAYKFTAPAEGSVPTDLTITANNTYNLSSLTLAKTITNNNGELISSDDDFVVNISNTTLGYNENFTISPAVSPNVTGLIVGETYNITETTMGIGYEPAGMLGGGGLTIADDGNGNYSFTAPNSGQSSISIQISNSVQFSNVEIKKTLGGTTLLEDNHTFDFYLWAQEGESKPSNPNITGVVPDGASVPSQNLIVGKTYIIEEAVKSGYTFTGIAGATPLTGRQYSFVAPASGSTIEIVATNKLAIVPSSKLELKKVINNGLPYNDSDNFTITIGRVKLDGSIVDVVDHIITADQVDQTINLTGIVAGQKYRIVESSMSVGYLLVSIDDGTNWEFSSEFDFIAPAVDTTSTITFTVTNKLDLGEVTIEKDFGSSSPLSISENFTFRVWKAGDPLISALTQTITTSGAFGTTTFGNLQSGVDYYITENSASGYSLTGVKDISDTPLVPETIEGVSAYKFTAPTSGAGGLKLKFTNERSLVALDIEKIITGDSAPFDPDDTFKIKLQRINSDGSLTIDPAINADLKVGTAGTLSGLVVGELYEITELTPPIGYVAKGITDASGTLSITETAVGSGKFRFTAPASSGSIKLMVENDYDTIPAGSIKIIKDMGGSKLLTDSHTFDFFLWKNGDAKPADPNITAVGITDNVDLPQLIAGQKYYIEEAAFVGYSFLSFTSSGLNLAAEGNGVYSFTAPTSTPTTPLLITANNTRDSINAVTLKKVALSTINNPENFEFIIWRNGDVKLTQGVKHNAAANATNATQINNLVPGQEYFIEETTKSGYRLDSIVGAEKVSGNVYKFTVPTDPATPLELIANNELSLVDITIVKAIALGALGDDSFTFNIWRADQPETTAVSHVVSLTSGATTGSSVVSGLISGQDYYVKEMLANPDTNSYRFSGIAGAAFETALGAYRFTAPPEGSAPTALTITATNAYNSGGLVINKVIDNNGGKLIDPNDKFTIKVVGPLGYDKEYTVSPAESATINDLIVGQTYTVSETIPAGKSYHIDRMAGTGITLTPTANAGEYTFVAPSSTATGVDITAYNLVDFTTVEILKFVDPTASILESNHSFNFYLWPEGDNKPATPNIAAVTPDGTLATSQPLIVGNKYYIEEAALSGYKIKNVVGATLENGKYAFTPPASGSTLQIIFTNELDLVEDGKVTLTKNITNGSPYQSTDTFAITVSRVGANGSLVGGKTYTIKANEVVNVTGLVAGQNYRVTESNLDSGYLFESIGSNPANTVTTNSFDFTAPASSATDIILITVKNQLDQGQVIIEKNFGDSTPLNATETFNFKLWRASESITTAVTKPLNVSGGAGKLIMDNLQGGVNYYIAENSAAGYVLSGVKLGNTPLTPTTVDGVSAYEFTAPLGAAGSITLYFTNLRDLVPAGVLTLEKTLSGTQTILDPTHKFKVSLQRLNSSGTPSTDAPIEHDLIVNTPTNITGLVAGESYEISETGIPTGYSFVSLSDTEGNLTLSETPANSGIFRFTAPPASTGVGHIKLCVENKHNILTGGVQIIKSVPAPGLVSSGDTFNFYVWHHSDALPPTNPNVVGVGTGAKVNLPPLIAGQKYYISEDANNKYSFIDFKASNINLTSVAGGVYSFVAPATLPTTPVLITASNNRASINAVSILKTVTDPTTNAADPLSNNKEFEFVVWHSEETESAGKKFVVKANNLEAVNINALVPGETYYIKETVVAGYELSGIEGANPVGTDKYSFVVPTTVASPLVLKANNNLKLVDGKAEIIKVTPDGTVINPADNNFEFIIWRKNTVKTSGVTAIVTANNNLATPLNQLIEGESYYIDEVKKTGYVLESMKIGGTPLKLDPDNNMSYFTLPTSGAGKITITVTNNFDYANLSLLKKFEQGQSLLNDTDTFSVEIWDASKPSTTAKTYTIAPNGTSVKVEGIVAGITYQLRETSKTGYKLKNMTIGGTALTEVSSGIYEYTAPAIASGAVVIEVNNTLDYLLDGTVRLSKVIAGDQEPLNPAERFEFKVWHAKADKPTTNNYSVPIGAAVHLSGLVVGEKYYVEETITKGYKLDAVRIGTANLSKDDTGYFFIAPTNNNTTVNIEAVNSLDTVSISVKKVMKDNQAPMKLGDIFTVTLKREGSNVVTNHQLMVNGESIAIEGLVVGHKYYITELAETFYRFNSFVSELAISSDTNGHYFIAPESSGKSFEITIVNELDTLKANAVGLTKEMYLRDDNTTAKPVSPSDQFRFSIWRDGSPKPSSPNYKTKVNNKELVDISGEIIAGAKYYVEEEGKAGYVFKGFALAGKPLSRDNIGYYFVIDSKDVASKLTLTAYNDLDILEKGTVLLEKVMAEGEKPLNNQDNFDIYIKPVGKNIEDRGERYRVKVDGDRVELGAMVAGQEYYVVEGSYTGYKLNKVYLNGNEMDRNDETGYFFFTAPLDGSPSVVTVENRLGVGSLSVNKYIDKKLGGSTNSEEELFEVIISSIDKSYTLQGHISSRTGEFTADSDEFTNLPVGKYTVTEVIGEESNFVYSMTKINVDEYITDGVSFEVTPDTDAVKIDIYNSTKSFFYFSSIPNAGGTALSIIIIPGILLVLLGIIISVKKKKKENH